MKRSDFMKVGIIGSGPIVETFVEATKGCTGITLQAIYSRSIEKAKDLAKKFVIPTYYDNMEEFLHAKDVNFIYVASPNALHYQHTMQALVAGKNVICEKPFTSTPEQLLELIELAKKKQLFLFEAITTIHLPTFHKVKELLPTLGTIKMVQCNYSQYSSRYDLYKKGEITNVFNPEMSGGTLVDLNIYNIHFVMGLFGKPKHVQYYPNKGPNGVDTSGIALLEYDNFLSSCIAAKDSASKCMLQVQGDKGYITIMDTPNQCYNLEITLLDGTNEKYALQANENRMYYELCDFYACYQREDYNGCYDLLPHSLSVLQTITALRKSADIEFKEDH